MSAAVIPFPVRRTRPAAGAGQYAWLQDEARRYMIEARVKECLASATPVKPAPEDEILKLLRRIDRRLAKIGAD